MKTHRTKSFNKNVSYIKPALKRKHFEKSHHRVANIIEVKPFGISPETYSQ